VQHFSDPAEDNSFNGRCLAVGDVVHIVKIVAEVHIVQLPNKTWQPAKIRPCELMYRTISRCWITGLFLSVVEYSRAQHTIGMRGHDHAYVNVVPHHDGLRTPYKLFPVSAVI
jgi:hypothetical protein